MGAQEKATKRSVVKEGVPKKKLSKEGLGRRDAQEKAIKGRVVTEGCPRKDYQRKGCKGGAVQE